MRTLKSPRSTWARYNDGPGNFARRAAKRQAAMMAAPAPIYPSTAPLTGDWLGGRINRHTVIMELVRLPGHRSDQWAAWIDGQQVTDAAGLTELWRAVKKRWPRAPSLQALATMQQGYSTSDEESAAQEHEGWANV